MIVIPTYLLSVILLLLPLPPSESTTGNATAYWPGDHFCGQERADGRPFLATDTHIAHRKLPLGTPGFLCNRIKCVFTVVKDRGPFGIVRPCRETDQGRLIRWKGRCHRWRSSTHPLKGWRYRGEFDLTRPVSNAIGHHAFEIVTFFYWPIRVRRLTV